MQQVSGQGQPDQEWQNSDTASLHISQCAITTKCRKLYKKCFWNTCLSFLGATTLKGAQGPAGKYKYPVYPIYLAYMSAW